MRRGQHAADDGSFGRSAGGAMARGIVLIAAAVVLGVILLQATDDPEPFIAANDSSDRADDRSDDTTDTTAGDTTTTTAAVRPPGEVTVLVANGSGVRGAAATLTAQVGELGYQTAPAANAPGAEASVVFFTPGYEAEARALAEQLKPGLDVRPLPDPSPLADLRGANVVVIQAADLAPSG